MKMEKRKLVSYRTYIREILMILAGCIPYAWSFVVIHNISTIPGSIVGVATICNRLLGTSIGVLNVILNIPLMIAGTWLLGRKMLLYTGIALVGTSALIDWWVPVFADKISVSPLWGAVWGGILMGIGAGIILYPGSSLAGTTVIGKMIQIKFPKQKLGNILIVLDSIIIVCGAVLMRDITILLYSLLYTLICMKIIDGIACLFSRAAKKGIAI